MVQVQSSPVSPLRHASAGLRAAGLVFAQLVIGAVLVVVAGMAALMTALAGLTLAAAALAIRFASRPRASAAMTVPAEGGVTLEARRTPRGWTVE
ncbi:hypothetical protein [Hyphomonas sp.]|uniref:hypothetical protein n=1 Tax=Hyphomonas sp. TaxID=87 RepID=UPI00391CB4CF